MQQSNEELCNLLIQSLMAKDEKLMQKVLEQEDEAVIRDIIDRLPINHVRKFSLELRNQLSSQLTVNHLRWLQSLLALKFSAISSMADGRSIILPLLSLLEDRSSPDYCAKMQGLRGKLTLLKQLKEARKTDAAEIVVTVPSEPDKVSNMEVDSATDTESEDLDEGDEDGQDETVPMEGEDGTSSDEMVSEASDADDDVEQDEEEEDPQSD